MCSESAAEIRDPIHGYICLSKIEKEIIDTPVFQRLRRIRQLSGAHLTYPGAQHSRFEHSIGTMYLAGLASRSLLTKNKIKNEEIQEIRLAALLHDIGHGPFSHLFEEVLANKGNITHEIITQRVLRETEIKDIIESHGFNSAKMSDFALGRSKNKSMYLNEIIAGGLSVDIMDYLLRDSHFTGVEYGKVDIGRIINSYDVVDDTLALDQASLYAFESLMIARYEMFKAVYFHKTVRAADIMLVKALTLADETLHLTDLKYIENYLLLTDEITLKMLENIKSNKRELKEANRLALDYRDRRLLKCVYEQLIHRKDRFMEMIFRQKKIREDFVQEIAKKVDVHPDFIFIDVPTAPSVPFTSSREALTSLKLTTKTYEGKKSRTVMVNDLPIVNAISGFMDILRIYTCPENRNKVEKEVEKFFGNNDFMTRISV
jgi:HD superfamily phosphohydrolase